VSDKKPIFSVMKNLSLITQLGLSIAMPIVLPIFAASYLQKKFRLGDWVVPVAVIIGLYGAASSIYGFVKYALKEADKSRKDDN